VRNHDLEFLKHFSQIIAFLVVVTIALIGGAIWLHNDRAVEPDVVAVAKTEARLRPLAGVYAGETGAAALAAAAEAAAKAAQGQVAYEGTLDGGVIYVALCGACHNSGAGGAPLMQAAVWEPRVAQGVELLVKHAIEGYQGSAGLMPARGGNPSLTDEQVEASVLWMLDNLK
jgi:cytochrome c5